MEEVSESNSGTKFCLEPKHRFYWSRPVVGSQRDDFGLPRRHSANVWKYFGHATGKGCGLLASRAGEAGDAARASPCTEQRPRAPKVRSAEVKKPLSVQASPTNHTSPFAPAMLLLRIKGGVLKKFSLVFRVFAESLHGQWSQISHRGRCLFHLSRRVGCWEICLGTPRDANYSNGLLL